MEFFLRWLKGIFSRVDIPPHDYIDSTLIFPELDVDRIARLMRLTEEGENRGVHNEPPANQETFDDIENRVITKIQGEVRVIHETAIRHLRAYSERLAALKIATHLAKLSASANTARTDFNINIARGRDLLFEIRRDVVDANHDFDRFRLQHGIMRAPTYPLSRRLHWGVIALLVLVEAALNGNLLARGLELGLLGGVIYALTIAMINIGSGLVAGRIVIPNLRHRRALRRLAAGAGLLCWLIFAVTFNLAVAHYRAALGGDNPAEAERTAMHELRVQPWRLSEISSWLLFILGISFASFAAADGWRMDDSYPGYGAVARRRDEKSREYSEQKEHLTGRLEQIRDAAHEQMDALGGEIEMRAEQYRNVQHKRSECIRLFREHLKYLEQCGNDLLSKYRQANRMRRTASAPAHFAERWQLSTTAEVGPDTAAPESTFQNQINDTLGELGAARQSIDEAFQSAVHEFEGLEELSEVTHANPVHQRAPQA